MTGGGQAAGALLVAPPDPYGPAFPPEAAEFREGVDGPLPFPALVVASTDDPYGTTDWNRHIAARWAASLVELEGRGHINAASGLGDWDEGWHLLTAFRTGLGA